MLFDQESMVIYVAELVDVLDNGDLRFWHLYDASQDPKRY